MLTLLGYMLLERLPRILVYRVAHTFKEKEQSGSCCHHKYQKREQISPDLAILFSVYMLIFDSFIPPEHHILSIIPYFIFCLPLFFMSFVHFFIQYDIVSVTLCPAHFAKSLRLFPQSGQK